MYASGSSALAESFPRFTTYKEMLMESSHVTALQSKHANLEAKLRDELSRPAPDDRAIREIKRKKLRIKEELAQI